MCFVPHWCHIHLVNAVRHLSNYCAWFLTIPTMYRAWSIPFNVDIGVSNELCKCTIGLNEDHRNLTLSTVSLQALKVTPRKMVHRWFVLTNQKVVMHMQQTARTKAARWSLEMRRNLHVRQSASKYWITTAPPPRSYELPSHVRSVHFPRDFT